MSSSPLVVEGLEKSFQQGDKQLEVLKGLSMRANNGEMVAIMGPSGSGKSTLLHVIAGLTPANAGQITINGQDIAGLSDRRLTALRRRHIGLVFQAFNLIPTLNVHDNIALPMLADGRQSTREEIAQLAERLGISDKIGVYPNQLSGGEQQRVAIARALLPQPALILADEPTGNLDSDNGQALCKLLRSFCDEEQHCIVLVTHEPAVAIWSDRVLVLRDGCFTREIAVSKEMTALDLARAYQEA
jgi:putative ABC transport system ATP-binding protein